MKPSPLSKSRVSDRTEGWGNVSESPTAHYFRDDRSLCTRWMVFGTPYWESNQALGTKPTKGTCKACWKKRAKEEGVTNAG